MAGLLLYIMFGLLSLSCANTIAERLEVEFKWGDQLLVFFFWMAYLGWILGGIAVDTCELTGWGERKTEKEEENDEV